MGNLDKLNPQTKKEQILDEFFKKGGLELEFNNFSFHKHIFEGYVTTLQKYSAEGFSSFKEKFKESPTEERDYINLKLETEFEKLKDLGATIKIDTENKKISLVISNEENTEEIKKEILLLNSVLYYLNDIDRKKAFFDSSVDLLKQTTIEKVQQLYGEEGSLPNKEYARKLLNVINEYFEYHN